jgi:tetratricopeptide (TPR) repeat protein
MLAATFDPRPIMLFRREQFSATFPHRKFLPVVGAVLALLASAHAVAEPSYDPRELRLIPAYCKYTQYFRARLPGGNNPDEIARWTQEMGGTFNHMHHYCWGLMDTYRATLFDRDAQSRKHDLYASIGEFDYVITKAPPDFKYLPEMLTKKGENLILLDRGPEGVGELRRAIEIRPSYWQAYATLSDYFKDTGDPKRAREWLEKGLEASPNVKALTRRLDDLNAGQRKKGQASVAR